MISTQQATTPFQSASLYVGDLHAEVTEVCVLFIRVICLYEWMCVCVLRNIIVYCNVLWCDANILLLTFLITLFTSHRVFCSSSSTVSA